MSSLSARRHLLYYLYMAGHRPPLPAKLPKRLYRFFWDTDAAKVNPRTHPDYVINRLLDKGDLAADAYLAGGSALSFRLARKHLG